MNATGTNLKILNRKSLMGERQNQRKMKKEQVKIKVK